MMEWAALVAAKVAPATPAPATPATPAPANTVRVNPINRLPATDATPCDGCNMKCGVAAKCQCIDFDVPNHTRKFATDMRKSKAGNDYTALSAHKRSSCYGRKVAPYQIQAMVQTLSHNGWESRYVGGKPAPVNNPFGGTATTDHEGIATHVVPVPGGENRITRDNLPMCRATNETGKNIGQLCTTKVYTGADANPASGTCRRHQALKWWQALGAYVPDPITPPYDQSAIPEVAPQPAGTGDEATGAQTADVAGTTGNPMMSGAQLKLVMETLTKVMASHQPNIDGLS
jgi:hypothetical protein